MRTSLQWVAHFRENARHHRINWLQSPSVTPEETATILHSLQAWQLGETSDGSNLLKAATAYAHKINDLDYIDAVQLFIKEEQKHGNNLGLYLDRIGRPRIQQDWGDTLFRKIRYFQNNMEIWTLTVITVESAAQIFYQSLKDATRCSLLKEICTDILIDEAHHIDFQKERFAILFSHKTPWLRGPIRHFYHLFFLGTALTVWLAHRKLFIAGGNPLKKYMKKMMYKYEKTIARATAPIADPRYYYAP